MCWEYLLNVSASVGEWESISCPGRLTSPSLEFPKSLPPVWRLFRTEKPLISLCTDVVLWEKLASPSLSLLCKMKGTGVYPCFVTGDVCQNRLLGLFLRDEALLRAHLQASFSTRACALRCAFVKTPQVIWMQA